MVATGERLRFTLAAAAPVTFAIYDVAGRRVAKSFDRVPFAAGAHVLPLDVSSLRAGLYLYRLATPDGSASGKLVVSH